MRWQESVLTRIHAVQSDVDWEGNTCRDASIVNEQLVKRNEHVQVSDRWPAGEGDTWCLKGFDHIKA